MGVGSSQSSIPARKLAERLRALRDREHEPLTQDQLAIALGGEDRLSAPIISRWENPNDDRLPPPQRLDTYARLFCTSRSFASERPRLLQDEELTDQERQRKAELYAELCELRDRVQSTGESLLGTGQRSSIWRFADEEAVSIVCPEILDPPPYARQDHLNYTRSSKYADLDALLVVLEQVKAVNPKSVIKIMAPRDLKEDYLLKHLIMIGGAVVEASTSTSADTHNVRLPVYDKEVFDSDIPLPIARPHEETHFFECKVGDEERKFWSERDDNQALAYDVGLIGRCPHLITRGRTVTVLSGITSRGVHGAALCFADPHVRDENERYLRETFASTDRFCMLMRIRVLDNGAVPPNLWGDSTVLYEWSDDTGGRWKGLSLVLDHACTEAESPSDMCHGSAGRDRCSAFGGLRHDGGTGCCSECPPAGGDHAQHHDGYSAAGQQQPARMTGRDEPGRERAV